MYLLEESAGLAYSRKSDSSSGGAAYLVRSSFPRSPFFTTHLSVSGRFVQCYGKIDL